MPGWTAQNIPDQSGKVAIVTGANTGLGYQTALGLAGAGAHVILAARDAVKGREAVSRIQTVHRLASVEFALLDLASLTSVAEFAARIVDDQPHVDLLINNAGVASPRKRLTTRDGFELQFGVNFLGHFALTARLMPTILKAIAPRVVSLSSIMHKYGRLDFDDLMSVRQYSPIRSYSQSKLATLVFARELARRAGERQWNLLSVAAHPGIARTDLTKPRPGQQVLPFNRMFDSLAPLFTGTAASGALPTLYAATATKVESGEYYGPTGWGEIKGAPGVAKSTAASNNVELATALWTVAERHAEVSF